MNLLFHWKSVLNMVLSLKSSRIISKVTIADLFCLIQNLIEQSWSLVWYIFSLEQTLYTVIVRARSTHFKSSEATESVLSANGHPSPSIPLKNYHSSPLFVSRKNQFKYLLDKPCTSPNCLYLIIFGNKVRLDLHTSRVQR